MKIPGFLFFFFLFKIGCSQSIKKYSFDINPVALYGVEQATGKILLERLDSFLLDMKRDISRSHVIRYDPENDGYDFSYFYGAGRNDYYKPLLLVAEKVSINDFLVKMAYLRSDSTGMKMQFIYNVYAKKKTAPSSFIRGYIITHQK
ncbi:hypothetical protein [Niabella hibiscisoli]|uniref:hypothetical protein n=1 Tax=Niabella hibiscisoli TaxID=1825928 RepID=UPI001F10E7ED|nr:hypothetical protein [Niabella hibiscisoli]MCH5715863.1 hypothetical protein [Niabella hibiscisoli]